MEWLSDSDSTFNHFRSYDLQGRYVGPTRLIYIVLDEAKCSAVVRGQERVGPKSSSGRLYFGASPQYSFIPFARQQGNSPSFSEHQYSRQYLDRYPLENPESIDDRLMRIGGAKEGIRIGTRPVLRNRQFARHRYPIEEILKMGV